VAENLSKRGISCMPGCNPVRWGRGLPAAAVGMVLQGHRVAGCRHRSKHGIQPQPSRCTRSHTFLAPTLAACSRRLVKQALFAC
jgi:hypothetical protein